MAKYYREPAGETFPMLEEEILGYWGDRDVPAKVIERMAAGRPLVFCEGPPTPNHSPHLGDALPRAVKDALLRYQIMNGRKIVPFIAGWDCHGLPVEIEIEKELGIYSKAEIEDYGLSRFNDLCRKRVTEYMAVWERMSKRIGYWLDYENAYITMSNDYIESVWWAVKQLHQKGMLRKERRVAPYCYRCGTALSSHEVALGFREIEDRTVMVRFRVEYLDADIISHTTSPWTLVANMFLAVRRDWDYVVVEHEGERLLLSATHAATVLPGAREVDRIKGETLLGKRYRRLFDFVQGRDDAFYIVHSDEVPATDGTGVVQISPAYAAVDYEIALEEGSEVFDPVDDSGRFTGEVPDLKGKVAGDSDAEVIRMIETSGRLFRWGLIRHSYPFCWRCDTPLIYKPKDVWVVAASDARNRMQELNEAIRWVPGSFMHDRFSRFISEAKDWVVSRARYWGTPLPVWRCPSGHEVCVGSLEDLKTMAIQPVHEDVDLHRPSVDDIALTCPDCGGKMAREEYVLDCWFDSGCAPFAQYHYPFDNIEEFDEHRAVDLISESEDQTRGWFYTQHVLSTLLFDSPAFTSVLVMGQVFDAEGKKVGCDEAGSDGPESMFSSVGADASRLYLLSAPVWETVEISMENVRESMVRTLTTLLNIYSYFASNSNRLNYRGESLPRKTHDLDVWILSRMNSTVCDCRDAFDALEVHRAVHSITRLVDDLSNWYLRRSRKRFLQEGDPEDRFSAYSTLNECLITLSKLMAPITPFLAEGLYKSLNGPEDSVHLERYPEPDRKAINSSLEAHMTMVRSAVDAGRLARQKAGIKLRQPLDEAVIAAGTDGVWVLRRYERMLADELNVKSVECIESRESMIEHVLTPNLRSLGPRLKESASEVAKLMEKVDGSQMARHLSTTGRIRLGGFDIFQEDVVISEKERAGYSHASVGPVHVYVSTSLRPKLRLEGLSREVIRRIQHMRKEMSLEFGEPIIVEYSGHPDLEKAIDAYEDRIIAETHSQQLTKGQDMASATRWTINKMPLEVSIRRP